MSLQGYPVLLTLVSISHPVTPSKCMCEFWSRWYWYVSIKSYQMQQTNSWVNANLWLTLVNSEQENQKPKSESKNITQFTFEKNFCIPQNFTRPIAFGNLLLKLLYLLIKNFTHILKLSWEESWKCTSGNE